LILGYDSNLLIRTSSYGIYVDGCVTLKGNLKVILPEDENVTQVTILTFKCSTNSTFSSVTLEYPSCNVQVHYTESSVYLVFERLSDCPENGQSLWWIVIIVIVVVAIAIVLIVYYYRPLRNFSFPFRDRKRKEPRFRAGFT